jgi:hypothetical protein
MEAAVVLEVGSKPIRLTPIYGILLFTLFFCSTLLLIFIVYVLVVYYIYLTNHLGLIDQLFLYNLCVTCCFGYRSSLHSCILWTIRCYFIRDLGWTSEWFGILVVHLSFWSREILIWSQDQIDSVWSHTHKEVFF